MRQPLANMFHAPSVERSMKPAPIATTEIFLEPQDPYATLGLDDIPVLSQLASRTIRYDELPQANVDYVVGSETLISSATTTKQDTLEHNRRVLDSREAFYYDFLGLKPKQLGYSDHERPVPVDVFVAAARTYFKYGIDPRKLIVNGDRALRVAPEYIDEAVTVLVENGLNPVHFFEHSPMTGSVRPDVLRNRITYFLDTVGVTAKNLEAYSSVTARSENNRRINRLTFAKWGQNGEDIGRRFLRAFTLSPDNIDATFQALNDLGIQPDAIARFPSLVGNSISFIKERVGKLDGYLKDIGFLTTGAEVLYECPVLFGAHDLKIDAFMTLMKYHKNARKILLPDNAKMFKRFERAPIRRLMANIILDGSFGLNTKYIGKIDEKQVVADALVDPDKLQAIGRPSVIAYVNYECKNNPEERDRILQITNRLSA